MIMRTVTCLAILAFIAGCASVDRSYEVNIVVPDGFQGRLRIIFDESGVEERYENGKAVFEIPESGLLATQGENPFLKLGEIDVRTRSGKLIRLAAPDQDSDQIRLRVIGGTSDGSEFWAVVGTKEQVPAASAEFHAVQSELTREEGLRWERENRREDP